MARRLFQEADIRRRRQEELRRLKRELEVTRQERDILKKAFMVFSKTEESGYYAWDKGKPSRRQMENEHLAEQIRLASDWGRQVYGSP